MLNVSSKYLGVDDTTQLRIQPQGLVAASASHIHHIAVIFAAESRLGSLRISSPKSSKEHTQ